MEATQQQACSKRVAKQKNKRAAQGEATQQPANLTPCRHFDMRGCHLLHRHGVTQHIVCNAATAIRGIVIGHTAMATARNRAMAMEMAVVLEEEGDGKGGKSDGNGNKEGIGKQR
jgi:hypothetical protein